MAYVATDEKLSPGVDETQDDVFPPGDDESLKPPQDDGSRSVRMESQIAQPAATGAVFGTVAVLLGVGLALWLIVK